MPTDTNDDVLHWRRDDRTFALGEWRMLDEWELNERILFPTRPSRRRTPALV
jgi:hypothetical protein